MRIVVGILLLLGGLIGLGMTACGGIVSVMSLGKNSGGMQMWAISLPSLLVGLLLLRLVARQFAKWRDGGTGTPPLPPA
jgi:hypothetical protein